SFHRVRDFVLKGPVDGSAPPVTQICDAGTETPWKGNHVACVLRQSGRILVMVSVYGDCQLVEFGPDSRSLSDDGPVAMCRWDGRQAQMVPVTSVPEVIAQLRNRALSFYFSSPKRSQGSR